MLEMFGGQITHVGPWPWQALDKRSCDTAGRVPAGTGCSVWVWLALWSLSPRVMPLNTLREMAKEIEFAGGITIAN